VRFLIKGVTFLAFLFLVLLIVFFLFRETILNAAVMKVEEKLRTEKGIQLTIGDKKFESFFNVSLSDVTVCSPDADTIIRIDSVFLSPRFTALLRRKVEFKYLDVFRPRITIYKTQERDNISFLFRNKAKQQDTVSAGGYGAALERIFDLFYDQIPDQLTVKSLDLTVELKDKKTYVVMPDAFIRNNSIMAVISFPSDSLTATYVVEGYVDRDDHQLSGRMYGKEQAQVIPFFKEYYDLKLYADTLKFSVHDESEGDDLALTGKLAASDFFAENWRIAPDPVKLDDGSMDYKVIVGAKSVVLDSSTTILINKLTVHPYFSYSKERAKIYDLVVKIPEVTVNDFFASLPEGIFEHTRGIKGEGSMSYKMDLHYDESKLDSLQFHSAITKKNVKISSFGKTDPRKMNSEFMYTAYEKGKPVRTFPVGPSNSSFVTLDQISTYLKTSVMTSEDGNFYFHNGFNADAFRKSIIENIREHRFKRGGSTISMQLVKNVFLTRNKNISRKIEEAMLTWLIESNRLVSKDRMLEVYLNIIEWGPGVYGIGEASRFYFDKSPADLSLNESIFLAMIVPQPKGFRYHFDEHGKLKPHVQAYYNLLARHLLKKQIITEDQQSGLVADIEVKGPAANSIKVVSDTLQPDLPDLLPEIVE
jgi:hypothetical protein